MAAVVLDTVEMYGDTLVERRRVFPEAHKLESVLEQGRLAELGFGPGPFLLVAGRENSRTTAAPRKQWAMCWCFCAWHRPSCSLGALYVLRMARSMQQTCRMKLGLAPRGSR